MAGGRDERVVLSGTGRRGGPMAERLLKAGQRLVIFDTNEAAVRPLVALGATAAQSALDVANQAETVFASLPTPDIVRQSIIRPGGALEGSRMRHFVDLSSSGAIAAAEVASALAARGIRALDAPVSGGVAGGRPRQLTVMGSRPRHLYDTSEPPLAPVGPGLFVG